MTRPDWLPAEFHDEFDALCRDMLRQREPNPEAAELLACCALLKVRWRAAGARQAEMHPPDTRPTSPQAVSIVALFDAVQACAWGALAVVNHDSRH